MSGYPFFQDLDTLHVSPDTILAVSDMCGRFEIDKLVGDTASPYDYKEYRTRESARAKLQSLAVKMNPAYTQRAIYETQE